MKINRELEKITPLEQDFSRWYTDVLTQGKLIEYGPTKGSLILKPNAYGMWENIQVEINKLFAKEKIKNVYLPLMMPKSLIEKEKSHIKGFAPELATITSVGEEVLEEPIVLRPTSEPLFGELFRKEVESYNDLPILYNQWANVVRWEKTTNPFLRGREFLWQEGHTVHASAGEAKKLVRKILKIYSNFCRDFLAIPLIPGKKTNNEKFAGAVSTYTIEAMMNDGRALQIATSHYLGQNFSKAFDVKFKNEKNQEIFAYQTSFGISTRLLGAIVMVHGDNRGVIMPPKIAATQIDILELFQNTNDEISKIAKKIAKDLSKKYRVRLDTSDKNPGYKASMSEIEGTPIRIEIGPKDLARNVVTLVRRDTLEKMEVKLDELKFKVAEVLQNIQNNMYLAAKDRLYSNIVGVDTYDELKSAIEKRKFVVAPFAGNSKIEKQIKEETGATARCLPLYIKADPEKKYKCIISGTPTKRLVVFAKGY